MFWEDNSSCLIKPAFTSIHIHTLNVLSFNILRISTRTSIWVGRQYYDEAHAQSHQRDSYYNEHNVNVPAYV